VKPAVLMRTTGTARACVHTKDQFET